MQLVHLLTTQREQSSNQSFALLVAASLKYENGARNEITSLMPYAPTVSLPARKTILARNIFLVIVWALIEAGR